MKVIETKKYRTLKYIIIGLLMIIESFLIYLTIVVLENQSYSIHLILSLYGLITIPIFIAISFPMTEVSDSLIKIKFLGLFKIQRQIEELKFSFTDKGDGLKIANKFGQKLVTIYQENTVNYSDIIVYLDKITTKGHPSKTSNVRWTYTLWLSTGLISYIIYWLTR